MKTFVARHLSILSALVYLSVPILVGATAVTNPLGNVTLCGLIKTVLSAAMVIGVPVAVLLVVFAGLKFVMAMGDTTKLSKARENLWTTILGIAIFFGAGLIAQVIITTMVNLGALTAGDCTL